MSPVKSTSIRWRGATFAACAALAGCGHVSDGFSMAGSPATSARQGALSVRGSAISDAPADTTQTASFASDASAPRAAAAEGGDNSGTAISAENAGADNGSTPASSDTVAATPADAGERPRVQAKSSTAGAQPVPTLLGGVLNTTGNALLASAADLEFLGAPVQKLGATLAANGLGGVPLVGSSIGGVPDAASGLASVQVTGLQPIGWSPGAAGPVGVAILSPAAINGGVANLSIASGGQMLNAGVFSASPAGAAATGGTPTTLLAAGVGQTALTGAGGNALVSVNLLSPTPTAGTLATASVLSGNQTASVGVNTSGVTSALTGAGVSTVAMLTSTTTSTALAAAPVGSVFTGTSTAVSALPTSVISTVSTASAPVSALPASVISTVSTTSAPVTTTLASTGSGSSSSVLAPVTSTATSSASGIKTLVSGLGRLGR